jgi:hypothetical protein
MGRKLNAESMATQRAAEWFERFELDRPFEMPEVTQVFFPGQGWRRCLPDFAKLSPAIVQHHARRGVTSILLTAYGHDADFRVMPAGPISPAYLI